MGGALQKDSEQLMLDSEDHLARAPVVASSEPSIAEPSELQLTTRSTVSASEVASEAASEASTVTRGFALFRKYAAQNQMASSDSSEVSAGANITSGASLDQSAIDVEALASKDVLNCRSEQHIFRDVAP